MIVYIESNFALQLALSCLLGLTAASQRFM